MYLRASGLSVDSSGLLSAAAAMQAQLCTILDGTSSPASESLLEVEVEEGDAYSK